MAFRGIQAETVKFQGFNGKSGGAYYAFFAWYRANYRSKQAPDGWKKAFAFFERSLGVG